MNLFKSILHNVGVIGVGLALACACSKLDLVLHSVDFHSTLTIIIGSLFLAIGFVIRVWATYEFYERRMDVIVLHAQRQLITSGPYRFSRNPLYLGGNVFIFFGAALIFGTPTGLLLILIHLPLMNLFIRREEKQLEHSFGAQWLAYKKQVPRWI